jgi:putative nucleotidyltransferase with HDIG domain
LVRSEVQQFINTYNQSIDVVNKAFETTRKTQEVPFAVFVEASKEIQRSIPAGGNIIDQLYNLPPCDDYTFRHSVNVSVITALLAGWLGYPPDIVNHMSLVGLLHDIGKSQLPPHILHRPNLLPDGDYKLYKKHTHYGYELLQKALDIPQTVKSGVIAHHEREDGSGYPYHLTGDKIHPYAKIVAIADLYDEGMTINRDADMLLSPYTALERLKENIYKIDARAAITFIDRMTNFLSGNVVVLTDSQVGRVVFINKDIPSRSIIQLEDGQVVDLTETPDVHILHLI